MEESITQKNHAKAQGRQGKIINDFFIFAYFLNSTIINTTH